MSETEATSEEDEHPDDRRVRLAQRYLDNIREEIDEAGFDAEDLDRDLIAQRLRQDVDEATGRQYRLIADTLDWSGARHFVLKGTPTKTTSGVAVCPPYAYTVSKDKCLVKWELDVLQNPTHEVVNGNGAENPPTQKKRSKQVDFVRGVRIEASSSQQHGHTAPILCVAASPDGRYVATGGADKKLIIWSTSPTSKLTPLKTFTTHRDAVTSLSFSPVPSSSLHRPTTSGLQLFSASLDRTIKTYSLDDPSSLAYVETLFGHQDHVLDVSAMSPDQAVSVGARDRTARLWRVVDETQLVFRADSNPKHETHITGSVDRVAALPPTHFVTGSDSGALSLWTVHKKKPLATVAAAHGTEDPPPINQVTSERDPTVIAELAKIDRRPAMPRAITALTTLPGTDLVLSASWDDHIRVWRVSEDKKTILPLGVVGTDKHIIKGIVTSLVVFESPSHGAAAAAAGGGAVRELYVLAGTGREPRLGRWRRWDEGRNGVVGFQVSPSAVK